MTFEQAEPIAMVTVIVPVYATEAYLPDCLESLFRQTYTDFDVIVVDDCSPGDCLGIVRQYQGINNPIFCARHEENRGLLYARLTGVERSGSKYIAFLDSDDTAREQFLETLITAAEQSNADIVGSARFKREVEEFTIDGSAKILSALCTRRIPNHNVWTKLFRRTLFDKSPELMRFAESEHIVSVEDVVITSTLCGKANRFVQVGKVLVDYNKGRPDSSWNSIDADGTMKSIREIARVVAYIASLNINEGERLCELIIEYFYRKKFLNTDLLTRKSVVEYLRVSPAAKDLRAALARADGSKFHEMIPR